MTEPVIFTPPQAGAFNRLRWRRGTPGEWATKNPILAAGEPGLELITGDYRIGDGVTRWNDLPVHKNWAKTQAYIDSQVADIQAGVSGVTEQDLTDHVNSLTPHPVYDEGPSLILLYENAKV